MAAQGKTGREEVFDPATARNGYSRIQKHQAFGFGEEKVERTIRSLCKVFRVLECRVAPGIDAALRALPYNNVLLDARMI